VVAMAWVIPADTGISGTPSITDLQLSWTSRQFAHDLAEWSGEACSSSGMEGAHCVWPRSGDGDLVPPPVADGPAGFRRMTLLLDYAFPILYSLFAIGLTIRLWGLLGRRRWLVAVVGAGVAAALCDMAENTIHLWLLRGIDTWEQAAAAAFPGGLVAAASVFASIKYGILALFVLGAVVWLVRWPFAWRRDRDSGAGRSPDTR
ncbi:MAG: hypothetical protein KJ956_11820, partial [Actinobacteria bacterium]|nr:hypothetical protein [Actinomycetota bacterium]